MLGRWRQAVWLGACLPGLVWPASARCGEPGGIDFNRDVRPILSETCWQCHGPDAQSRQADLRLDVRDDAVADRGGWAAIVPGEAGQSGVIERLRANDETRMPPPESGLRLSAAQVATLERWIAAGAAWQGHWAFEPVGEQPLPEVRQGRWVRNPIDRFVLARLEAEGLSPSREADRETLLRRVSLDLTGLPPSPSEADRFLADSSPEAYERLVERLLASPHYGERMALPWLYAARYADTNGYQSDGQRYMWRWRDWVIEAFNGNLPYDQFTIEQLAGDLLAEPTLDQLIATGFNRNHRGNAEGGIIAEEYLVEYAVDRLETTAAVWLGLTIGCARCHEHKYDPISQREFYQLLGYFNSIPEKGKVIRDGNSPPLVKSPTRRMQAQLDELDAELAAAQARWGRYEAALGEAQVRWERSLDLARPYDWTVTRGLAVHCPLDDEGGVAGIEGAVCGGRAVFVAGAVDGAVALDGQTWIELGASVGAFEKHQPFSLAAWVFADGVGDGAIVAKMDDDASFSGYELCLDEHRVQLNLINRQLDDALRVETADPLPAGGWHHIVATYDGSELAAGVRIYVDGRPQALRTLLDTLSNPIKNEQPLRIGSRSSSGRFHGRIDEVRIYNRALGTEEAGLLSVARRIDQIAGTGERDRTPLEAAKIKACFVAEHAPAEAMALRDRLAQIEARRRRFYENIPTTMIMQELVEPRPTFVLTRGAYDRPGERVERGVPACLPPLEGGGANDRLALARWLVDPRHPLTARVAVNRFWQMYFGRGLVETSEDFGSQGQWPTHPELLDWLARRFVSSGWDVKGLVRLIVTSATYRQSSRLSAELAVGDPDNHLLARGPRFRLDAELVRDQALSAAGLLVSVVGGPSVKPYQPPGIWEEIGNVGVRYVEDRGESLYRRSLYTFWKRTAPPPAMMTFDATSREMCTVRSWRTNTPMQALNLMNDVTFVEASRALAQRVLGDAGAETDEPLVRAFRLVLVRRPTAAELEVLRGAWQRQRSYYREHAEQADALLEVGQSPVAEAATRADLAAMTTVCGLILNLDEAVTKE